MVGLRIAIGHILIEALFVLLIFLGFSSFLTSETFMRIVSGLGGIALIGMGFILLRGVARMSLTVKHKINSRYGAIAGGAFFSIASPGFLIWWSTIGLSVILKSLVFGLMGFVMVAVGHWIADIGWHWSVSYFLHKERNHLKDGTYRGIIRLLAVGLIVTGLYFCSGVRT